MSSPPKGFRPCVGIVLINALGRVFAGERLDSPGAWQMPQGGIDEGESVLQATERELREETSITSISLLAASRIWRTYDLPPHLARDLWGGKYRGQAQLWALYAFTGQESEICIETSQPEFQRWQWVSPETLICKIVPFKRAVYSEVFREFMPRIKQHAQGPRP